MSRQRKIILVGQRFGKLQTLKEAPKIPKHYRWECKCDCGNIVTVNQDNLLRGNSKSCGRCNTNKYEQIDENTYKCVVENKGEFIFDKSDYELIKNHKWIISTQGYVVGNIEKKQISLHRFLMNSQAKTIDHINGNTLDNRRCNLRPATRKQNCWNSRKKSNNTSGYKGVWWSKEKRKYSAEIYANGTKKHLGYFDKPTEAAKKYDEAASFYFGSFAKLNFAVDIKNQ